MAYGSWLGVSQTAKPIQSIHIGDYDHVARKAQAAWIGDADNKARLFYQSAVIVPSIESYYKNGSSSSGYTATVVTAYKNGYCGYVFAPAKEYDNCKKVTMYIYVTERAGEQLTMIVRNGSSSWLSYNAGWGNKFYATPSALGWNAIDITEPLNTLITDSGSVAEDGIKVYFSSANGVKIAGKPRGQAGEFPAYLVLS